MIALIQRVSTAHVDIDGAQVASIASGIMTLVGIEKHDKIETCERLLERVLNYRIFPDEQGRMNRSLRDTQGGLLLVPQFTLVADTERGTRPGFSRGATPEQGKSLFKSLCDIAKLQWPSVGCGQFGADMQVHLCNDGPVTFWLQIKP